jgi:hypothetical protein
MFRYLLSPSSVLTCVGQSTHIFQNILLIVCFYAAVKGTIGVLLTLENISLSTLALAGATYLSIYCSTLFFALIAFLQNTKVNTLK